MALNPIDIDHSAQIQAGIKGRRRGHEFEFELAEKINHLKSPYSAKSIDSNVFRGEPASTLLAFAIHYIGWKYCDHAEAIALGALATAEEGKKWLEINGAKVRACKSDILLNLKCKCKGLRSVGVSVKQCNKSNPTNAQLFFTTAHAFCELLRRHGIDVSIKAENALKQFCGDDGYRPQDNEEILVTRKIDPRRFFWEEILSDGRIEFEAIFTEYQDEITQLLLQKAYLDDPFIPKIIIHKTKKLQSDPQEFALYSIENLISLSREYQGFEKKLYKVNKGKYKESIGASHEAPRFGIVQMQRGGQKQHPTQLQFNLEAGYFYKI